MAYIPIIVCNINQVGRTIPRHPICITDAYHDYILDEITHQDEFEFEI